MRRRRRSFYTYTVPEEDRVTTSAETTREYEERLPTETETPTAFYPTLTAGLEALDTYQDTGTHDENTPRGTWTEGKLAHYVRYGWPEGAKRAATLASTVANRVVASATSLDAEVMRPVPDVVGAAYDVGALIAGEPEMWLRPEPTPERRAVRLVVDCTPSGAFSEQVIERRGEAVTALALVLQSLGYPLTVDTYQSLRPSWGEYEGKLRMPMVRLADSSSGSPLDVDRLAFGLGHPMMLRGLLRYHVNGHVGSKMGDTWGAAKILSVKPDGPIDVFVLGMGWTHNRLWNNLDPEAWVTKHLEHIIKGEQ